MSQQVAQPHDNYMVVMMMMMMMMTTTTIPLLVLLCLCNISFYLQKCS